MLALRQRDATGEGCHLDIAMTDAMFTFAWHASAAGWATGRFRGAGETFVTGGSPRYRLYPTRDGKLIACGVLEQHFWSDLPLPSDLKRISSMIRAIRRRARQQSPESSLAAPPTNGSLCLRRADRRTTIVATLQEALHDPHFVGRGLFDHRIAAGSGATMPALPVPVAPQFEQSRISKPRRSSKEKAWRRK